MHYVATLREQLEEIALERTPEGFPRLVSLHFSLVLSKALVNDYSQKIEAIAANLASPVSDAVAFRELRVDTSVKENINNKKEDESITSPGLRRRLVSSSSFRGQDTSESSDSSPVKLDAAAQTHISKHRKLQEDLTDEMVVLARQLKENSLKMNKSIQNTERILDSTEKAVEHSLATTGRVNTRATAMYSESFKTSCFTWFVMFVMLCVFVMVVLLIKVT
uniref:Putative vesicle transport protein, Use1 n=1 Tax=Helianthus annuus TaxID=4232 RepID=A0A251TGZ9_HELAN